MHIPAKSYSHFAGAPAAVLAFAALTAMALTGCANRSLSSQTFPALGAQTAWNVEYGERVRVLTANIVTPGPTPVHTGGIFGGSRGIGRTGAPFPVTRARVQHL